LPKFHRGKRARQSQCSRAKEAKCPHITWTAKCRKICTDTCQPKQIGSSGRCQKKGNLSEKNLGTGGWLNAPVKRGVYIRVRGLCTGERETKTPRDRERLTADGEMTAHLKPAKASGVVTSPNKREDKNPEIGWGGKTGATNPS